MKEMIYDGVCRATVLYSGIYKGRQFYIISYGMNPCAYVERTKKEGDAEKEQISIDVHGGLTYDGTLKAQIGDDSGKRFLGWDYAHDCDFVQLIPVGDDSFNDIPFMFRFSAGDKWTTEEIYREVKYVIDQLEDRKKEEEEK